VIKSVLPSEIDVQLLVCEDIRMEMNHKLTLAGFFPGNSINVGEYGPKNVIPLAFLLLINGGEGTFVANFALKYPDGKVIVKDGPQTIQKNKNQTAAHFLKVTNFPIPQLGPYVFEVTLDGGAVFRRQFTIGQDNPSLASQP
jgi:hypothetical protein